MWSALKILALKIVVDRPWTPKDSLFWKNPLKKVVVGRPWTPKDGLFWKKNSLKKVVVGRY